VRRFFDASRRGRCGTGKPVTAAQELVLLRSRLTVMQRAGWLKGLRPELALEFERFRRDTVASFGNHH